MRTCSQRRSDRGGNGALTKLDIVSRGEGPAATILDVARRAGVSRTTVSRVLNEPELVTADTLKRVQDAAAALNFTPNRADRG